jgi:hypothetical protein
VTSEPDPTYNCIAFAADDLTQKWDPTGLPMPGYYWPPGADKGEGPDSLRSAFEAIGYALCSGGDVEAGFEKVVLYINDDGEWTHAAKQQDDGEWRSKLGERADVQHKTQHCFIESIYGKVVYYMRRPLSGVSSEPAEEEGSEKGQQDGAADGGEGAEQAAQLASAHV